MTDQRGGRAVRGEGAEAFVVGPFHRLARTHALSVAGDALLAVALADSLFFNVDPNDARWKVAAYLILTLTPFAVVAPLLGPAMDRLQGGHRFMILVSTSVRAALMFALVRYVQGPMLFPLAFSMLVMGKTYAVAKSALVPAIVPDHDALVRSNSRLSVLAGVSSAAAGVPGVVLLRLGGSSAVLALGVVVFIGAALFATRLPAVQVAPEPPEPDERTELRGAGIVLASGAMGYLRGVGGFVTLLLAFTLRGGIDPGPTAPGVEIGHRVREALGLDRLDLTAGGAPAWHFGVALAGVGVGGLAGSIAVPRLRTSFPEERILAFALFSLAAAAGLASLATGVAGAFLAGFGVSLAGTGGKQSFDAVVQRDAPTANLGRSFSRFESRFQLLWVVGALCPVVLPIPARLGYLLVTASALFVGVSYRLGRRPDLRRALGADGVLGGLVGDRSALVARLRQLVARSGAGADAAGPPSPPGDRADNGAPPSPAGDRDADDDPPPSAGDRADGVDDAPPPEAEEQPV